MNNTKKEIKLGIRCSKCSWYYKLPEHSSDGMAHNSNLISSEENTERKTYWCGVCDCMFFAKPTVPGLVTKTFQGELADGPEAHELKNWAKS